MSIVLDGTNGITTPTYGGTDTSEYLVPVTAFKNRIINGAMGIWQRGTSSTTTSAGYYTADRWASYIPSGTGTISQDSSLVPSGFQYGLRFTASSSAQCNFYHTIETKNCYDLAGQNVTLSFYAAGTAGLVVTFYILYSTTVDASFTSSFTTVTSTSVTLTGTQTKYSVTGAIPSNAQTIQIFVTPNTMSNTQYYSFTGVQLEKGSTATSFDYRPYGTELQLCQRYYWKTYATEIAPSTVTSTGNYGAVAINGGDFYDFGVRNFPIPLRASPTITIYNYQSGASGTIYEGNTGASRTGTVAASGATGVRFSSASMTNGYYYLWHITASAEL